MFCAVSCGRAWICILPFSRSAPITANGRRGSAWFANCSKKMQILLCTSEKKLAFRKLHRLSADTGTRNGLLLHIHVQMNE